MTPFEWSLIGSFFVLLVINTLVQYRLGFSAGTTGGYTVGMFHAVTWLLKNNAIDCEHKATGLPATAADIVVFMIKSKQLDDFSLSNMEDITKIAEATLKNK